VTGAVLVRHAETEWSLSRRHTGRTDLPLTDKGREQAKRLAALLEGIDFTLVLCSPLRRARETATLVGFGPERGIPIAYRDDLMEWDYGEYEGITTKEIHVHRPDWDLWRDGAPGGESPDQVKVRVDRVIAELLDTPGIVAVVAHGHLLRALGARWVEQPPAFGRHLALSTASISRLGFEREHRALHGWNRTVD
jgi:broad specificity phosphatase PhoE